MDSTGRRCGPSAACALLMVALCASSTAAQDGAVRWVSVETGPVAVMLDPSPASVVVATVTSETRLRVRDLRNGWYFVTLPKEAGEPAARSGWLTEALVVPSSAPVPAPVAPPSVAAVPVIAAAATVARVAVKAATPPVAAAVPTPAIAPAAEAPSETPSVSLATPSDGESLYVVDKGLPSGLKDLRALRKEFDQQILALEGHVDARTQARRDEIDQAIRALERLARKSPRR